MMKKYLLFLFISCSSFGLLSQEINTDELFFEALEEYRNNNFRAALELTNTALTAAPDYHDIRLLRVRNLFALSQFEKAHRDIIYLLEKAPQYEGVRTVAVQRLYQLEGGEALEFTEQLIQVYGQNPELNIRKARLLLENDQPDEARKLATEIYENKELNNGQRYILFQLMNLTVKDAVQFTGQFISFSDDYPRNDPWYVLSADYQHNFTNLSLIGRVTFSDRSYNSGSLYEIEAYPIFSEGFYAFGNLGFSDGTIFPDFRASASVFYNFAPSFEFEAGFRSIIYGGNNHFTGIGGLTTYTGRFYLNIRAFIGPERLDQMIQNYQFNVRYYLSTPENYIFGRLGSGISPDEPAQYTLAQENPNLEAYYLNVGLNHTLGLHHVISISGGILQEDLANDNIGQQLSAGLGYRYKF